MKKYKVMKNVLGLLDLVNVEDPYDRFMCEPDFPESLVGSIISESEFDVEDNQYVDDQGFGVAPFAFKK